MIHPRAPDQYAALVPVDERVLRRTTGSRWRPRQPRPLDREGGGPGGGPRPVRGAAPGGRAGPWPRTPAHADRPRQPRLLHGGGGDAAGPATSLRRCCRSSSKSLPRSPDTLTTRASLTYWTTCSGPSLRRESIVVRLPDLAVTDRSIDARTLLTEDGGNRKACHESNLNLRATVQRAGVGTASCWLPAGLLRG